MSNQTKICNECKIDKDLMAFNKYIHGKLGHENKCRDCQRKAREKKRVPKQDINKKCTQCGEFKNSDAFHAQDQCVDGLRTQCIECVNNKILNKINTLEGHLVYILNCSKQRANKKDFEFDLTYNDLFNLYNKQNGLCAISNVKMTYEHIRDENLKSKASNNVSIDRINPNKGYTKDNIQLLCCIVNNMKLDLKEETFYHLCKCIAQKKL